MMEKIWVEISSSIYERLIAFEKQLRASDSGMGEQDTNFTISYLLKHQKRKKQTENQGGEK